MTLCLRYVLVVSVGGIGAIVAVMGGGDTVMRLEGWIVEILTVQELADYVRKLRAAQGD